MTKDNKKVRTTGQLREYLIDTMDKVATGVVDLNKALVIGKLASHINENVNIELKSIVVLLQSEGGYEALGNMNLGSSEELRRETIESQEEVENEEEDAEKEEDADS